MSVACKAPWAVLLMATFAPLTGAINVAAFQQSGVPAVHESTPAHSGHELLSQSGQGLSDGQGLSASRVYGDPISALCDNNVVPGVTLSTDFNNGADLPATRQWYARWGWRVGGPMSEAACIALCDAVADGGCVGFSNHVGYSCFLYAAKRDSCAGHYASTGYFVRWLSPEDGATAVGDPHLENVHGERFDLMKSGNHILLNIPRGAMVETALLLVQADARRLGGQCADLYFQELNITGAWAEAKRAGGYHYSASHTNLDSPGWVSFDKVALKVVNGNTDGGLAYLNVYVKHLRRAGFAIGGLLGEDDHEDVIVPPEACVSKLALFRKHAQEGGRRSVAPHSAASFE
jgi:hypothetical protein